MSKWKIIDKNPSILDLYAGLMSFGLGRDRYIVENTETGERRIVFADDADDLGRKISSGDFDTGTWHEQRPPREKKQKPRREKPPKRQRSSGPDDDSPGCSGCFVLSLVVTLLFAASTLFAFGPRYGDSRDISSTVGMAVVTLITGLACWIEKRDFFSFRFVFITVTGVLGLLAASMIDWSKVGKNQSARSFATFSVESATPPLTPHDSRQGQAESKLDGKLHNPLDNKEFMDGIHNFLRGDGKSSGQPTPYTYTEPNNRNAKELLPKNTKPQQTIPTIGIPAGTYVYPAVVDGKYGRLTTTSDFTVEGDRFTFLHREDFSPSAFGVRNGRINYPFSYTVRWHGIVTSIGASSYVFKPTSVQLVDKSPSRLPFSATHVPTARELSKFTWTFDSTGGRLRERDTGNVWNIAR